ncbi:MAG: AAA family ATPase [Hyphomicrobiales bacterium]|nr:MAG: AAA family ATPase [Hyphomicrobiales bacterium]
MERNDETNRAFRQIEKFARVLHPKEAEEPILAKPVRAAIYEWLTELNAADELAAIKVKPRRTALLYGPPGTGKTTLAHHLAARLGVPLIAVQSEQLVDSHLGATGKNIAILFDAMDVIGDNAICLFDEIDAIGSSRSNDDQACAREMNAALTTILTRIEQFKGVALAATNRRESLDPALWRRFGMQIEVALPGFNERYAILARYLDPMSLPDADMAVLAELTEGASPSLLEQMMHGIKRTLTLAKRLRSDVSKPEAVFETVLATISPPHEMPQPRLWSSDHRKSALEQISGISWPPTTIEFKESAE